MSLTDANKGISKILFILFLLIAFLFGALFSYVYTIGYYAPSEFRVPDKPTISIQSVVFDPQNTRFFDVTVLNPSYSQSDINITRIEARTTDDNIVHVVTESQPSIPFTLGRGHSQTFRASWDWGNYTGITLPYTDRPVEIRVFLQDGRGEILELKRPIVRLIITGLEFNQSISLEYFYIEVQNSGASQTYVNITAFGLEGTQIAPDKVTPSLPLTLNPGDSPARFQCFLNWTALMGKTVTVGVSTLQGYIASATLTLPQPVILNIPQVTFNATISTQQFNITVVNAANSSTYVDINRITIAVNQQNPINLTWTPYPSSRLETNSSVILVCNWDWSSYAGQSATVTVSVYTSQGLVVSKETGIP
jgi:hypothetical protein